MGLVLSDTSMDCYHPASKCFEKDSNYFRIRQQHEHKQIIKLRYVEGLLRLLVPEVPPLSLERRSGIVFSPNAMSIPGMVINSQHHIPTPSSPVRCPLCFGFERGLGGDKPTPPVTFHHWHYLAVWSRR